MKKYFLSLCLLFVGTSVIACGAAIPPKVSTEEGPEILTVLFPSIFPLFKSSCAATIAGAFTYCTVGMYNKRKEKIQQHSQKKWALGAAVVAGIGTFAYLYLSAPVEL